MIGTGCCKTKKYLSRLGLVSRGLQVLPNFGNHIPKAYLRYFVFESDRNYVTKGIAYVYKTGKES